jgi:hypothetical protein
VQDGRVRRTAIEPRVRTSPKIGGITHPCGNVAPPSRVLKKEMMGVFLGLQPP